MKTHAELFNLDFGRWEIVLLSLIPASINLGISLYSFLVLDKSKTTAYFSLFTLFLGLWGAGDGLMKMSQNAETAGEWNRISMVPALMYIPIGIQFVLCFAGWVKGNSFRILSILLFLPTLIFFVLVEGKFDENKIAQSDMVYWIVNPQPTPVNMSIFLWFALGAVAMVLVLWGYYTKTEAFSLKRKQALLLASGLTFPVIGGVTFEILFPLFFNYDDIPVTVPLLTIFSITSIIAIRKYKMMEYSPKYHWEQIVQSLSEGILIVDNDDRIKYANDSLCKLLGYEFSEINGQIANELFLNEEDRQNFGNILEARKNKESGQYEMPLRTKQGNMVWMLVSGSPYLDQKGNVIGSIGIQTDLTHLRENERVLEHNESRLRQAQAVAHVGSWELDFATQKAMWSEEACKMYGISPEKRAEQTYESWISVIHPEDIERVKKVIEKNQASLSDSSFKHRIVLPNGTVKHIHSVSRFEFDSNGVPTGLFGICHDITEQVEAERALTESEKNISTFINESLMSIYFVDPGTKKILYSNPAFSELLGYSTDELKNITIYDFIDEQEEHINERMRYILEQKKINNGERQWRRKDGKIISVLISSFYHKHNGTDTIYVAAQDISERKKAEEKLAATNQDLKTFIYKASHDIRGPLASIMGLVTVSKLELKEAGATRYLDMINTATQKLDYTLSELVKAMRIKEVETFSDEIDFIQLIDELLNKFTYFPGYNQLTVSTDISLTRPFISDRSILETIMQNLIENVIKYQKTNGEASFLKINISNDSQKIKIIVEDNGVGIEEALQSKVFDMYFRANTTTNGSGLGLYLVQKGIEKLNGEVMLKSKIRQGTTITVLLPYHKDLSHAA